MERSYGYFDGNASSGTMNAGLVPFTKEDADVVLKTTAVQMSLEDVEMLIQTCDEPVTKAHRINFHSLI